MCHVCITFAWDVYGQEKSLLTFGFIVTRVNHKASTASSVVGKNDDNKTPSSASAVAAVTPSIKVVTIQVALATPSLSTATLMGEKNDDNTSLSSATIITVTTHPVHTYHTTCSSYSKNEFVFPFPGYFRTISEPLFGF